MRTFVLGALPIFISHTCIDHVSFEDFELALRSDDVTEDPQLQNSLATMLESEFMMLK
ncbi:hypothetical protein SARC_17613, partial [Sphaeroforma arctica JP610]